MTKQDQDGMPIKQSNVRKQLGNFTIGNAYCRFTKKLNCKYRLRSFILQPFRKFKRNEDANCNAFKPWRIGLIARAIWWQEIGQSVQFYR